jgi:hypothetical protein
MENNNLYNKFFNYITKQNPTFNDAVKSLTKLVSTETTSDEETLDMEASNTEIRLSIKEASDSILSKPEKGNIRNKYHKHNKYFFVFRGFLLLAYQPLYELKDILNILKYEGAIYSDRKSIPMVKELINVFLDNQKYTSTNLVSFEWNRIDLSPETLALKFNEGFDTQMFDLKTQKKYRDGKILKFKDPIRLDLPSNWKFIQKQYKKMDKTTYKSITYQSSTDLLTAIDCKYNDFDEDAQMLVYITKNYFVIVGVEGKHPFIQTPYINYSNSDGSGPDILLYHKKPVFDNPIHIVSNLIRYYNKFVRDWYH